MNDISDKLIYELPFRGANVNISQGYFGKYSHFKLHRNYDQSYSLDFALELGTDVLAARAGYVKLLHDEFSDYYDGVDFKTGSQYFANFIELVHSDGTFTCYQHLKPDFISDLGLKKGDYVEAGELIAKTGLSGWIGGIPHLHFSAYKKTVFQEPQHHVMNQSFPTKFRGFSGSLYDSNL